MATKNPTHQLLPDPEEEEWLRTLSPLQREAYESFLEAHQSAQELHSLIEYVGCERVDAAALTELRASVAEHIVVLRAYVQALEKVVDCT
jgi:hypothetical protein